MASAPDRGGWIAIRSTDESEPPEWSERVAEWIRHVQPEEEEAEIF